MTKTILLGAVFAAVAITMMVAGPVFAASPAFQIESASGFTMTTVGKVGTATEGHDLIVHAFITDTTGDEGLIVYVAAVHPSFNDDEEQAPGNKQIHAHKVELTGENLCVAAINNDPSMTVSGNTITITDTDGETVVNHAIIGYDVTDEGLCATELYVLQ